MKKLALGARFIGILFHLSLTISVSNMSDLAELADVAFNDIGGVNQAPDLSWIIEKSGKFFSVVFPGAHGASIFVVPQKNYRGYPFLSQESTKDFFQDKVGTVYYS